ncbi:MAG TPA: 4-(cytidine 5'-diphospho)-2-C-methyl-D-erythritol kinase [Blastocatellia bacterium]|nr:4-(cytidine 5'-diphospho)-2-C-methyl-D-erythritol kinase [Blastocatellia bacterium]HMV83103.1 4-(cytidine 5'-diphospho)-2-C-methyl-D-erythritol kinase [Blastocatellia bacterium]HMZ20669.1 4-(cytidine 5'-diphospho)-2-C-methyl-D-erythritol kinase [Blastocatellia bacterium]HNG31000.1 4-(cytidine 5'-diphospho)-2-C-methyl-D-erythritol kinase [Blastocatellia bacterium]
MKLLLPSFGKINWTLEILGKRPDGYHELRTLLQTVSVADELIFESAGQGIEIVCDHPDVPCDETNLVHRAARLLSDFAGINKGVRVTLHKRIPTAAGLGGGSSNAAVTLLALQKLWGVKLPPRELFELGAKLGADVPFFFLGGTCLGVGRGDEVYPLADIRAEHLLLVNAGILVPTREVYANLPAQLTNPGAISKMPTSFETVYANITSSDEQIRLQNDLEIPVLARHQLLGEIKEWLQRVGASGVLMSGSGSTIFSIFETEAARENARRELSQNGWWCAATRTLGREEYQAFYRQVGA